MIEHDADCECKACRLFRDDPKYASIPRGVSSVNEPTFSRLSCAYRGDVIGRVEGCGGCPEPPRIYACPLYEKCVMIRDSGKRGEAIAKTGLRVCEDCLKEIPVENRLVIRGYIDGFSGYGRIADELGKALDHLGFPIVYNPRQVAKMYLPIPDFARSRVIKSRKPEKDHYILNIAPATSVSDIKNEVILTMWETDRIPWASVEQLNTASAVIVPCPWVKQSFKASGVNVPIHVAPLGINQFVYRPGVDFPSTFTFGAAGRVSHGGVRKGLDEVIYSFLRTFPTNPGVRLVLKVWPDCEISAPEDYRVIIDRRVLSEPELAQWYQSLSCFVSASCSEGFGFQPLEAMACGRPVIATDYSGHELFVSNEVGWVLDYQIRVSAKPVYKNIGSWGVPTEGSLDALLKAAYESPDLRAKGAAAARKAKEFTWQRTAEIVAGVMKENPIK